MMDFIVAANHAQVMLRALGIVGDAETPGRLVRALGELTAGLHEDPTKHLGVRFPPVSDRPSLVTVTDVPFVSVCEHHVLPFTGVATVAYLPHVGQDIVGLSKLARLVQGFAARPQVQERLTAEVVEAIVEVLEPAGAACAVRGIHACMSLRGACTGPAAAMVTTQYAGELAEDPWRREFTSLLDTASWK